AGEVRVRIPHLRGVEAVPRRLHQRMAGEARRQRGAAGIPEPFGPRPCAERARRRGGGGERTAREKKAALVQKTSRPANS
ncbi:MAG TPA: hypothetical protein VNH80_06105, partial [Burkholderiales bacterium]|nr:hypothetical protein [Burkholderiales bacterium]